MYEHQSCMQNIKRPISIPTFTHPPAGFTCLLATPLNRRRGMIDDSCVSLLHELTTSPYGAGAGRLDALLNAVTTLGLLIITGPKDVFTFARDSKFGAVLNAAICAYLLFANLLSGRKGGGDDGSRGGDSSGAGGGNYLLTTVAFAGLLLLATPGMMRALR